MQFALKTDYAIRLLIYLAAEGNTDRLISASEISGQLKISEPYLRKVIKELKYAGTIVSYEGSKGGYRLAKKPKDISFWDVILTMENTSKLSRCLEEDAFCNGYAQDICSVRKFYWKVQQEIEESMSHMTIEDMLLGQTS